MKNAKGNPKRNNVKRIRKIIAPLGRDDFISESNMRQQELSEH